MVRIAGGNYTSMAATGGVVAIHIKVILFRMEIAFYFSFVLQTFGLCNIHECELYYCCLPFSGSAISISTSMRTVCLSEYI